MSDDPRRIPIMGVGVSGGANLPLEYGTKGVEFRKDGVVKVSRLPLCQPGKQVYIAGSRPVHRYRLEWTEAGAIFDAVHVNTTRAFNWLGARAQAEDVAHTFGWKVLSVRRIGSP
jgi:hypothetical protein